MSSQSRNVGAMLVAVAALALGAPHSEAVIVSFSQPPAINPAGGHSEHAVGFWKGVGAVGRKAAVAPAFPADFFCSGTLLTSPQGAKWVLTAAHCVEVYPFDIYEGSQPSMREPVGPSNPVNPGDLYFHLPDDPGTGGPHQVMNVFRHPKWLGDNINPPNNQYDVALLELANAVPNARTFEINSGQIDERYAMNGGIEGKIIGYGIGGTGPGGEDQITYPFGVRRDGVNKVNVYGGENNNLLLFDFDNHTNLNQDALGIWEANTTHGDSGGPMLMWDAAYGDYRVVGVTRGGQLANARFGDLSNDVRVAHDEVKKWIQSTVPEPGTVALLLPAMLLMHRRRRRG